MFNIGDFYNESFEVTDDVYKTFLYAFKDKNPMHVDKEYSCKYGFTDILMHGNILNGFISYFVGQKLPIKNVILISQNINYKTPFYLNEKLFFKMKVIEIYKSVNVITFKFNFTKIKGVNVANGRVQIKILS